MNYANINDNQFQAYYEIPDIWKGKECYRYATPEQLLKDGFWELKTPIYDIEKQYLGEIIKGTNDFTYKVLNYSVEQIQQKIIENAEITQQTLIDEKIKEQNTKVVLDAVQAETDVVKILENQSIYPLWSGKGIKYEKPNKVQAFNAKNELKLYECIQPHTSQDDWSPNFYEAGWKLITPAGEIGVWSPRNGSNGYAKDTVVWFTKVGEKKYKSKVNDNVYSPSDYPANWELVP